MCRRHALYYNSLYISPYIDVYIYTYRCLLMNMKSEVGNESRRLLSNSNCMAIWDPFVAVDSGSPFCRQGRKLLTEEEASRILDLGPVCSGGHGCIAVHCRRTAKLFKSIVMKTCWKHLKEAVADLNEGAVSGSWFKFCHWAQCARRSCGRQLNRSVNY